MCINKVAFRNILWNGNGTSTGTFKRRLENSQPVQYLVSVFSVVLFLTLDLTYLYCSSYRLVLYFWAPILDLGSRCWYLTSNYPCPYGAQGETNHCITLSGTMSVALQVPVSYLLHNTCLIGRWSGYLCIRVCPSPVGRNACSEKNHYLSEIYHTRATLQWLSFAQPSPSLIHLHRSCIWNIWEVRTPQIEQWAISSVQQYHSYLVLVGRTGKI